MDRIPCCSVSMHTKHFKLGQATDHYMRNQKENYIPSFTPVTMTMVRVIVTMVMTYIKWNIIFLSIVLRVRLMCKSFLPRNVFKQNTMSPYNVVNFFFFGGGRIFDAIFSYRLHNWKSCCRPTPVFTLLPWAV